MRLSLIILHWVPGYGPILCGHTTARTSALEAEHTLQCHKSQCTELCASGPLLPNSGTFGVQQKRRAPLNVEDGWYRVRSIGLE